jgi:translation initiation factor IF-3
VRLVGDDGEQFGIVSLQDAFKKAAAARLDLVLVGESAEPPVCKVMDFGKLQYEQKKKLKDQRKSQHAQKLKEIKFHISIDNHDYEFKKNHAYEFLGKGFKLKITLMFRGREMAHKEMGFEFIAKVTEDLKTHGTPDGEPKLLGRNIIMTFSPKSGQHKTAEKS